MSDLRVHDLLGRECRIVGDRAHFWIRGAWTSPTTSSGWTSSVSVNVPHSEKMLVMLLLEPRDPSLPMVQAAAARVVLIRRER